MDAHKKIGNGLLVRMLRRARKGPGHEFEQAIIRLIIGISVFTYIIVTHFDNPAVIPHVSVEVILYSVAGFGILAWLTFQPVHKPSRYFIANIIDIAGLSYAVHLGSEYGAALYPLYLWVTFGFGFRFGRQFLNYSAALSIIGFGLVFVFTPYWSNHINLYLGLLGGLIILPMYVGKLLGYLEQAIENEKQANKAKSQFLANMSHELRTPLNGVLGANDLLASTSLTKEQEEYSVTIAHSSQALLALIENILDISRIEAGKLKIASESFDIHQLLNSAVSILRYHALGKGLVLQLHLSPAMPFRLIADENHIKQVLINLMGNAIKYTPSGRVDVIVDLISREDDNCMVKFRVVDTGPGIPADRIATLFDRFTQVDETDTRNHTGAGLGTAIAKELVEAMGGNIGVMSEEGEGSTFWFELPLVIDKELYDAHKVLEKERVLVVGDKGPLLDESIKMLDGWGVDHQVVASAHQALTVLKQRAKTPGPLHAVVIMKPLVDIDIDRFVEAVKAEQNLEEVSLIYYGDPVPAEQEALLLKSGVNFVLNTKESKSLLFNALHSAPLYEMDGDNIEEFGPYAHGRKNRSLKILLVEDNDENRMIIRRMLEKAGHVVTAVNNGEEGLDALEQDYDVCLIDMQMPVMDGIEAVKSYRFMHPESEMPFIMLTANSTTDAVQRCQEVGIDLFLSKPIPSRELLHAVATIAPAGKGVEDSCNGVPLIGDDTAQSGDIEALPIMNNSLLEEFDNDPVFLSDILGRFLSSARERIMTMESSVGVDPKNFSGVAHALKGVALSIGAERLAAIAAQADKPKSTLSDRKQECVVNDLKYTFELTRNVILTHPEYSAAFRSARGS